MTVRLIEGQVPYTGGTAIEITADKVINLLLRAENNLLHVNDDNELYCDLQLENGIAVDDDLPVGVTTGIVNESDGRPQNGLLLHYETTSGAYAQWLYGGDGKLYFNGGTGERKLVYYAEDVDELLNQLYNQLVYELTMEAGEGISIVNGKDYSAMRGPCPEGFHIPMKSENDMLYNIVVEEFGLSDFETYLKMPIYGVLKYDTGLPYLAASHYMSCNAQSIYHCYALGVQSNTIYRNLSVYKSNGQSIRPVSDHILKPTQHWTVIYDGSSIAEGAGIFHNPGLGVISLSSDGENWITIADKNLGATTVFNAGDQKTSDNCGGFFQWGNNYMFPSSGATQTDNNKVNASDYGPGNYYTSNIFILTDWTDWDSSNNANLWGGVTGVQNMHNVINNTGVLSVNGRKGHVIVPENVKLFEFSFNTDRAQEAYQWILSGKEAIIRYQNESYFLSELNNNYVRFEAVNKTCETNPGGHSPYSNCGYKTVDFELTNGQVTQVTSSLRPKFNFMDPSVNYVESFNPTHPSNPTSKKYVDDHDVHIGTTAPTDNLVEGRLWYDTTNDVLKSYDGTNWNLVGDDTININTKTFYVADNNDLTTAQAAMDWYLAGKNPIIVYDNQVYLYSGILDTSPGNITFYGCNRGTYSLPEGISFIEEKLLYFSFNDHTTHQITHITRGENQIGKHLDPTRNYANPYTPQYDGSPATKKYVDDNDTVRLFTLTDRNDLTTAQAAYDWFLSGKLPVLKESGNYYYCYLYSNGWLQFTQTEFDGTIRNNEESHISKLLVTLQGDGTTVSSINHSTFLGFDYLDTNIDYSSPFIPHYNGSPATKIYVDQSGPCVPVYHLGGGNVMTSYINFDIAGGTYKIKIQGYHGTTINRTITVTASSALAGTFTSNLIEHYNYGCIVTIDPSISTTMTIQIDSNSNFSVDDIYIEKINIQSGIVTATAIQ